MNFRLRMREEISGGAAGGEPGCNEAIGSKERRAGRRGEEGETDTQQGEEERREREREKRALVERGEREGGGGWDREGGAVNGEV